MRAKLAKTDSSNRLINISLLNSIQYPPFIILVIKENEGEIALNAGL